MPAAPSCVCERWHCNRAAAGNANSTEITGGDYFRYALNFRLSRHMEKNAYIRSKTITPHNARAVTELVSGFTSIANANEFTTIAVPITINFLIVIGGFLSLQTLRGFKIDIGSAKVRVAFRAMQMCHR